MRRSGAECVHRNGTDVVSVTENDPGSPSGDGSGAAGRTTVVEDEMPPSAPPHGLRVGLRDGPEAPGFAPRSRDGW